MWCIIKSRVSDRQLNFIVAGLQLFHIFLVDPLCRFVFLVEVEEPDEIAYAEVLIRILFALGFDRGGGRSRHLLKVFDFKSLIRLTLTIPPLYKMILPILCQERKYLLQVLNDHLRITNLGLLQQTIFEHFLRTRKQYFFDHYGGRLAVREHFWG